MWCFGSVFPQHLGKRDPESEVQILFDNRKYKGWVTCIRRPEGQTNSYKIYIAEDLRRELEEVFLMSYMRDLESRLQGNVGTLEKDIPFWEFLDIEFDEKNRRFLLAAHYTQRPTFPELFRRLVTSPVIKRIDDEVYEKKDFQIYKQDWRERDDYELEIGVKNIIYMLIDKNSKLLYIGETEDLVRRFRQGHRTIRDWTHYRYDVLPPNASSIRVAIERMLIRTFATVLPNKREIPNIKINDYELVNDKIDS